jgi:hypothetical protein
MLIHQFSPYLMLCILIDLFVVAYTRTGPIASPCSIVQTSEITIKKQEKGDFLQLQCQRPELLQ